MESRSGLRAKLASVWPLLDERTRRLMAANEACALGRGGISQVSRACGLSRKAIAQGIRESHADAQDTRTWAKGAPVVSVDPKKKDLVGNYANAGRQWLVEKTPVKVQGHDFPGPDIPRAYPYGVYDIDRNRGFVNVGTDHDTA